MVHLFNKATIRVFRKIIEKNIIMLKIFDLRNTDKIDIISDKAKGILNPMFLVKLTNMG